MDPREEILALNHNVNLKSIYAERREQIPKTTFTYKSNLMKPVCGDQRTPAFAQGRVGRGWG